MDSGLQAVKVAHCVERRLRLGGGMEDGACIPPGHCELSATESRDMHKELP